MMGQKPADWEPKTAVAVTPDSSIMSEFVLCAHVSVLSMNRCFTSLSTRKRVGVTRDEVSYTSDSGPWKRAIIAL